jgi:hypothetical protein
MNDAVVISQSLQEIATEIDERLTKLVGHKVSFSLFVWSEGRSNYISTAPRIEVATVLLEHIKGWVEGMPDIPAHKVD